MKNKKQMIRIFSIFLMVCIMVSLMPATFLADKTTQEIPADAIHISTPEDLTALAENCQRNTWSVDKTVVLDNDIDVTEYEFSGIPTFGGTFLGQGFTIKGLEMTKEGSVLGFFRYLQETAVVDDLHLQGLLQPEGSKSAVGGIVGKNAGVIKNCSFYGSVSGNEQIGGLVGNNSGVIRSCINNGAVGYQHMGYNIGGIAGDSDTMIRNCSTKSVLAGDTYVGGIAGKGNEVTGCYAFVDIKAYTEKAGAILGNANELPDGIEDVITGNKYFAFEKAVGGIDGIIYENATEPLALDEFLQIEGLDETFLASNVVFKVEGQNDVVKSVPVGESLAMDEVPVLSVEEGEGYDWELVPAVTSEVLGMGEVADIEYVSEESLTNIVFDQTYEVSFDTKDSVVSSEEKTNKDLPILLAVGSFAKNTNLEVVDQLSTEAQVNEKDVIVNYQITLSNAGVEKLHFYLPEGVDGEAVKLFVKDVSGSWTEREFVVDGSYMVFAFTAEDTGFALREDTGAMVEKMAVVAIGLLVLIIAFILIGKRRKKVKQKNK